MSLRNLDVESVLRRLAEKRVEDAMAEGKFNNLPGQGEPIDIEEAPADEKARELWWALKLMKQNDFVPDEVRYRKMIDKLKGELSQTREPALIRKLCQQINHFVTKLNTMGTNAISSRVSGVDVDEELRRAGS
jgi:hypothetical protein